jgi:membrane protease YdiL (CAAX protease family)
MTPLRAAILGLIGGFVLYQIFGALLTLIIFGTDPVKYDITAYRLMMIATQVLFLLLPAIVFSKLIYSNVSRVLRFFAVPPVELLLFALGIFVLFPLINSILMIQDYWVGVLFSKYSFLAPVREILNTVNKMIDDAYSQLLRIRSPLDGLLVTTVVAITPAVCEEMLFRGYIQTGFELRFNKLRGAIITAFFFAAYHFNPEAFIGLFLLGWYFGYAAYKTNSILVPMFLHFIQNFISVILSMIYGSAEIGSPDVITPELVRTNYIAAALLGLVFAALLIIISRFYTIKANRLTGAIA